MSESKTFEELFLSFNSDTQFETKSLRILVISDINSNTMYLEKLKEWQLKEKIYFDLVLLVGNFISYVGDDKKYEKENICKCEAKIASMVAFIENLGIPFVYMPGKNDPSSLFDDNKPTFTIKSKNCYNDYFKIADDLYIICQGGYIEENEIISLAENYNKISLNFELLKKKIEEENSTPNIKIIFLTFDGPNSWRLDEDNELYRQLNNSKIKNSCSYLKYDKSIFINIHQNCKLNGLRTSKGISIINPGELEKGKFAILDLIRDNLKDKTWKIKEVKFLNL